VAVPSHEMPSGIIVEFLFLPSKIFFALGCSAAERYPFTSRVSACKTKTQEDDKKNFLEDDAAPHFQKSLGKVRAAIK
jgi:hypothetical protein